ncbi:hypothetical protein DY000_02049228 [Brassica cretica]|uniref:Uncharacterized protein n=1 Tax=Brassica cretica TaxID=69181 RepID=A0ABQ7EYA0_BRACR|nr:hypothetical protein DY000_02049228 [Brassica cretica]
MSMDSPNTKSVCIIPSTELRQLIHLNFLEQKSPQIRDRKKAQEMGLSADSHQKEAQRWITDGGKKG